MTAPDPDAIRTAAHAALDQAEAELRNLRAHMRCACGEPSCTYSMSRSAAIIAGIAGTAADKFRELAGWQSLAFSLDPVEVVGGETGLGEVADL